MQKREEKKRESDQQQHDREEREQEVEERERERQQREEKYTQDEEMRKTAQYHTPTATALRELANMGFTDTTTNTSLLEECHYNITDVITRLTRTSTRPPLPISNGWKVPASALVWKQKIGTGSFGSVYEVNWHGFQIAAKKMNFTVESERQATEKMLCKEFCALQQSQHPHIVRMHGVVVEDLVLLMEISQLGSLRRLLTTSPARVLKSEPAQFSLLIGIACGMSFLHHQKILHHDLKSDNVLLWQDTGSTFIAKIADFGLATGSLASTVKTTKSSTGAATLAYKAPEAFDGEFSPPSEVYAYSIIGWEVLTGKVPWEGYSEAQLTKAILKQERLSLPLEIATEFLGQIVQKCWVEEATQRPTFDALTMELEVAVNHVLVPSGGKVHVTLPPAWSAGGTAWSVGVTDEQLAQKVLVGVGAERREVEEAFMRTLVGSGITVLDVHRVQNAELWKVYAVMRQTILERKAGADDTEVLLRAERRWLFHGTDKDTVPKIIQQGFNRSFCGKNMTKYGKGVYFARDSSYSFPYAKADAQGVKSMFLCRVVVGEYCTGVLDACVPAARIGSVLFDTTVDDMADPSIYVTYKDAQAYPDYLVRFRQ